MVTLLAAVVVSVKALAPTVVKVEDDARVKVAPPAGAVIITELKDAPVAVPTS